MRMGKEDKNKTAMASRRGRRPMPVGQRDGSLAQFTNRQILMAILRGLARMSVHLDRLTASVAANTSVSGSIETLISGLAEAIRNNTDPVAVAALADELDATNARLAAAITANTPAPPVE